MHIVWRSMGYIKAIFCRKLCMIKVTKLQLCGEKFINHLNKAAISVEIKWGFTSQLNISRLCILPVLNLVFKLDSIMNIKSSNLDFQFRKIRQIYIPGIEQKRLDSWLTAKLEPRIAPIPSAQKLVAKSSKAYYCSNPKSETVKEFVCFYIPCIVWDSTW